MFSRVTSPINSECYVELIRPCFTVQEGDKTPDATYTSHYGKVISKGPDVAEEGDEDDGDADGNEDDGEFRHEAACKSADL